MDLTYLSHHVEQQWVLQWSWVWAGVLLPALLPESRSR
jgi:hypothetical protein